MKQFDDLIKWRDSFHNKAVGWIAFLSTMGLVIGFLPAVVTAGVGVFNIANNVVHSERYFKVQLERDLKQDSLYNLRIECAVCCNRFRVAFQCPRLPLKSMICL